MFYRQRILLALIDANDGKIQNTNLQKLLFLFCQETGESYYDFFPYKYGAFSFLSYYDKRKLTEKGYLKDVVQFELAGGIPYLKQLKPGDQSQILAFMTRYKHLRNRQLIRKTYLEYPEYALRSEIVDQMLTPSEKEAVQSAWRQETSPVLFTIGYEGKSIDKYLRQLAFNNITTLVDVRRNPFSHKHGFSKRDLQRYLKSLGIRYIHTPELGVESALRKNLNGKASYEALFEQYATHTLPKQERTLNMILNLIDRYSRVALTCFEATPEMCHRHKVAYALQGIPAFSCPIVHI